ncbi:MAG: hypothetical protein WC791_03915 [Candidatus Paceibacterota bacterium]
MDEHIISWTAPEYEHREHSADWYWSVSIITVAVAVAFIIVGNTLLAIIVVVGIGTLLAYSKHSPRILDYSLSKKGVLAGKTLYPWDTLASFWILEGVPDVRYHRDPKILIISKKQYMPHIVVPLDEAVMDEVHQALSHMLHEEPQMEPLPERLMRKIGF